LAKKLAKWTDELGDGVQYPYQGVRLIGENRTEYYVDARGGYCKHCPYDVPPKLAEGGDTFGRKGKH